MTTQTPVEITDVEKALEDDPFGPAKLSSTYCCAVLKCINPGIWLLNLDQVAQGVALCDECHQKYDWDLERGRLRPRDHRFAVPCTKDYAVEVLKRKYKLKVA
jgi:hypothetical protein